MSEPIFPNDCCATREACCCKDDHVVVSADEARRCLSLAKELACKKAGHRGWPSLDEEVNLGWVFEIDRTLIVRALRNYATPPARLVADASAETMRVQDDLGRLLHAAEAERDRFRSIIDDVHAWAESRCPCENEQPDPCPLCGARADDGVCRAVDKTFPAGLGDRIARALKEQE